jgi:hypothetical protein
MVAEIIAPGLFSIVTACDYNETFTVISMRVFHVII